MSVCIYIGVYCLYDSFVQFNWFFVLFLCMSEYEAKGDKANRRSWFNPFPDTDSAQDNYTLAANTFKREQKCKK